GDVTIDESVRTAAIDHDSIRRIHPRLDVSLVDAHVELVSQFEVARGNLNRSGFQRAGEGSNTAIEDVDVLEASMFKRNEGAAGQRVVVVDEKRIAILEACLGDDLLDHVVRLEFVADTVALG